MPIPSIFYLFEHPAGSLSGAIIGDGTLTGALEFVPLELAAALTGDGTLTGNAVLASSQSLSAALTGDGTLTGALRSLSGPRFLPSAAGSPAVPRRASASSAGASSRPTRRTPASLAASPTPSRGTPTPAGSP